MKKLPEILLFLGVALSIFLASKFPVESSRSKENISAKIQAESFVEKQFENVSATLKNTSNEILQTEAKPIALLLTGDIMLGRYIATLREKNGGDFPFTYMPEILERAKTELQTERIELVAANLEGPIVEKQIAWGDMVFRFDPEVAELLKKSGFTTLQLANNHSYNQRKEGYDETHKWLTSAGLDSFGQPDSVEGEWSFIKYEFPQDHPENIQSNQEVDAETMSHENSFTLGFLGLNDVDYKLKESETLAKIAELDSQVDFLIIGIHWGIEYKKNAGVRQIELAHKFVDSGVDFIWGTHPHVTQNSEVYKGAPIYYSLGNFVFDQYWSAETQKGLVLAVKISPASQSVKNTQANIFEEERNKLKVEVKEIPVNIVNKGEPRPIAE